MAFLEENEIDGETVEETYLKYSTWCIENGLRALSKNMFGREVKKQGFNSDSTIRDEEGRQKRIYRRNDQ